MVSSYFNNDKKDNKYIEGKNNDHEKSDKHSL